MKRPNISAEHSVERALMDWLGLHYAENIYYGTNHCPAQILRNCVHPKLGLQIMEHAKIDWSNAEGESRAASARTLHPLVGSSGVSE